ncbi:F-box/WD repeat-containing protein 9-like [Battus philenor]|uniref:F-box/WD repeat-containing protein 9-like n=1 Tax=Battus philenor TaxID=42288 RepID=UPI0035D0DD77
MCEVEPTLEAQLSEIKTLNINKDLDESTYEAAKPTLLILPVEILLKICSFLEADFLKFTLSKVCRRFEDILADDHLWKYWVHSKINGLYPVLPNLTLWEETPIDWVGVCVEMDVERKKWINVKDTMNHIVIKDVHYASVDTVLLANRGEVCLSGGRDRCMALWHVEDIQICENTDKTEIREVKPRFIKTDAHGGWVWDLAADNIENASVFYSASWDSTVKAWDLESGLKCIETFKCGMSALSLVTSDNLVMAGLFSKKILSFDLRTGPNPINSYKPHKGPVLGLNSYKNMVASLSEDKTLAIWDRVAGKLMQNEINIPTERAYPVRINWCSSALYISDSKGSLHLFNPENHAFVRTHDIWPESSIMEPSNKIVGCYQSEGNLILCSDRGEMKFLYNCYPPQQYASVKTRTIDVTQLRYHDGVLVIGTCDATLEMWIPKKRYN